MKYKAKFSTASKIMAKDIIADTKKLSQANLEKLKPLTKLDIKTSDNLAVVAFDLAVANMFNLNGHGIGTETAKILVSKLVNQPVNVEHERWNVVGHAINSGFYSRPDHDSIGVDGAGSDPFFISIGAVLYKSVRGGLVDWIKIENEEGYMMASASWEVAFDEYKIARGSNLLAKCEVLDSKEDMAKYDKFLRSNGGTGFDDDGVPVFMLICGEVDAVGMAITFTPAADVKGIFMPEDDEEDDEEDSSAKKDENKISQSAQTHVVANRETNMTIQELTDALTKALASQKDATTDVVISTASKAAIDLFNQAIKSADEKYTSEKESAAKLKQESEAKQKEIQDKLDAAAKKLGEMEQQLATANESIQKVEKERQEQVRASKIDAKMAEFDSKFTLTKDERDLALAELAASDLSDESVKKFDSKYSILFASKVKTATPTDTKSADKEISDASVTGSVASSSGLSKTFQDALSSLKLTFSK